MSGITILRSIRGVYIWYAYGSSTQEINSQAFELISLEYYDEIFGTDAELRKINKLMEAILMA